MATGLRVQRVPRRRSTIKNAISGPYLPAAMRCHTRRSRRHSRRWPTPPPHRPTPSPPRCWRRPRLCRLPVATVATVGKWPSRAGGRSRLDAAQPPFKSSPWRKFRAHGDRLLVAGSRLRLNSEPAPECPACPSDFGGGFAQPRGSRYRRHRRFALQAIAPAVMSTERVCKLATDSGCGLEVPSQWSATASRRACTATRRRPSSCHRPQPGDQPPGAGTGTAALEKADR